MPWVKLILLVMASLPQLEAVACLLQRCEGELATKVWAYLVRKAITFCADTCVSKTMLSEARRTPYKMLSDQVEQQFKALDYHLPNTQATRAHRHCQGNFRAHAFTSAFCIHDST